jgi:hypothetical protein
MPFFGFLPDLLLLFNRYLNWHLNGQSLPPLFPQPNQIPNIARLLRSSLASNLPRTPIRGPGIHLDVGFIYDPFETRYDLEHL